jgi:uncharacterized damage-inducible protein DinB
MQPLNIEIVPSFYRKYVAHVKDLHVQQALQLSHQQALSLIASIAESRGEHRYQPGKWSIKEVLCHMMDAERIFCYRALRFARHDKTPLHGFEENDYAPEANAHARTLPQLADEMKRLRDTTLDLFSSFTPAMLQRTGSANNADVSVHGIGYIIAGHETHHRLILEQRYLATT